MKKVIILSFLSLILFANPSFANEKESQISPNSILKEVEPGVFVPKENKEYTFEELNKALVEIHSKVKEKRLKEFVKDEGKDVVVGQDGELLGGTRWYYNNGGFSSIAVSASMDWSAGSLKSSWDYWVQGYSSPYFNQAKVKTWIKLYGADYTDIGLGYESYSYSSPWVYNNYTVARTGSGYDYGVWAVATSGAEFTAAPKGSTIFKTFSY